MYIVYIAENSIEPSVFIFFLNIKIHDEMVAIYVTESLVYVTNYLSIELNKFAWLVSLNIIHIEENNLKQACLEFDIFRVKICDKL